MCKHVPNAQVAIRAPCCQKWFDCAQCHSESSVSSPHEIQRSSEIVLACKKCKKVFRRDLRALVEDAAGFAGQNGADTSAFELNLDEADEFCPRCDNHFVIAAASNDSGSVQIGVEGSDARVERDDREKARHVKENEELREKFLEQALLDMVAEIEDDLVDKKKKKQQSGYVDSH